MELDRRSMLKVAGLYGGSSLLLGRGLAGDCSDVVCPPCPSGYILLELHNVCWTVGCRTYRPGRRYKIPACYRKQRDSYRVSAHPVNLDGILFWACDPKDPRRGLRTVLHCVFPEGTHSLAVFNYDCAPPCPRQYGKYRIACTEGYCKVKCNAGDEHCIPDTGGTYPCPEGPKGCAHVEE